MTIFKRSRDDFAEIASNPQRRTIAIVALKRRAKKFGLFSAFAGLSALALGWEGRITGALASSYLAMFFLAQQVQLQSDVRLLEVIDAMDPKNSSTTVFGGRL